MMVTVCGIDEAGRGPVIGPLVIAGACLDEKENYQLERIGVKDSKLLTPEQRERLFFQIKTIVSSFEIILVQPQEVDAAVFGIISGMNLNWLEAHKAAEILNKLHPDKGIIDCPSTNLTAYSSYLRGKLMNKKIDLICEHKADATYVICSAASILAKVTRDHEIEMLKKELGVDFGSGYPSDPKTVAFLRDNWNKYPIFRKSWSSWQKYGGKIHKVGKEQKKLGEW